MIEQMYHIFIQRKNGLRILGIIPGTPAERLDILIGETIIKVNGIKINTEQEFYSACKAVVHTSN